MISSVFKKITAFLFSVVILLFLTIPGMAVDRNTFSVGKLTVTRYIDNQGYYIGGSGSTGDTFYVDSNNGANATGGDYGKSRNRAFSTIDYAVGQCAANNNDIIVVMPGHSETITNDSGIDVDVAGINIVGEGNGEDRPIIVFTTVASADFKIAAANVGVHNLVFKSNIASQSMMIETTGDDAEIGHCEFREGTATPLNFITVGVADNDSDRVYIHDNKFYMPTAGNGDSAISFAKDMAGAVVEKNTIYGDFDLAAIDIPAGGNAQVDCLIRDNVITNLLSGQHCIQVNGTGNKGIISNIQCVTDDITTSVDAGGLEMFDVYHNVGTDQGAWEPVVSDANGIDDVYFATYLKSVEGSAMPRKIWYVDANIATSGNGKSPATAFKTITEAIAVCTSSTDDFIFVFDYSGGGGTITINQPFVHLIGNANPAMPYPRIKPASAVVGIEITAAGDRVEIANMVIGGGDGTVAAIAIDTAAGGGAYGVYIHDCVIGRDSDAPALIGVSVPTGGAAPYLVVDNNRFYGNGGTGIAAAGSAIKLVGNATRCRISNNYISDVGRTATPAIWLSGTVSEPQIVGNQIKTDTDTGTGSAITLSANVDDGWIYGNAASDGKDAPAQNPFVDAGSTNGWSKNISGIVEVLP